MAALPAMKCFAAAWRATRSRKQVQLALAFGDVSLAALELLQTAVDDVAQVLDLPSEICALKVEAKRLQISPQLSASFPTTDALRALRQTLALAEVDLLSETGARVAARITDQRPAHRRVALAVVVHVLFGDVGVVPDHFLLESPDVASCSTLMISARTMPSSR